MRILLGILIIFSFPVKGQIWEDDFEYTGTPDPEKWTIVTGDGCPQLCGWGNNELQYYTDNPSNVRVENGALIIEAFKKDTVNSRYVSGKIVSKNKGDWEYGIFEVRAMIPSGRGTWSAIWMLPTLENMKWPDDGEIDVMEHVGHDEGRIHGTVHTGHYNGMKGNQKTGIIPVEDLYDTYHVYKVKWTSEKIEWYVDDIKYYEYKNDFESKMQWPFDKPFHLIMNLAVGGNWGGKNGVDDSIWPQKMLIDWVKVYKLR